jgi:hypothetical protein
MAAFTSGSSIPIATTAPFVRSNRRRRICPEAGRALEILGHAIEYLTDEYVHQGGSFSADDAQLNAVLLLMSLNRQIYFECPVVPSFGERCRSFLNAHIA